MVVRIPSTLKLTLYQTVQTAGASGGATRLPDSGDLKEGERALDFDYIGE